MSVSRMLLLGKSAQQIQCYLQPLRLHQLLYLHQPPRPHRHPAQHLDFARHGALQAPPLGQKNARGTSVQDVLRVKRPPHPHRRPHQPPRPCQHLAQHLDSASHGAPQTPNLGQKNARGTSVQDVPRVKRPPRPHRRPHQPPRPHQHPAQHRDSASHGALQIPKTGQRNVCGKTAVVVLNAQVVCDACVATKAMMSIFPTTNCCFKGHALCCVFFPN